MVKENEKYIVTGVDYTSEGIGLAKVDGFPLFINNLIIGEEAEIKITKVLKNFGLAKIVRFTNVSPDRITPLIPETIHLGGCQFTQLNYDKEVLYKKSKVERALRVIGGFNLEVSKMHQSSAPYFYRNKTVLPLMETKSGKVVSGLYRHNTHDIVIMEKSHLDDERANAVISEIRRLMPRFGLKAPNNGDDGDIFKVMIRASFYLDEIMVVLITKKDISQKLVPFVDALVSSSPHIKTVIQNINPGRTNVNLGDKEVVLYGPGFIRDKIGDLTFKISSKSFFQVNTAQAEKLYERAISIAELKSSDVVLDAYCGIGTLTELIAKKAKYVIGVEIVKDAVEDAKENAKLNKINNIEFYEQDAGDFLVNYQSNELINVVFVDPPRKGLDQVFINKLLKVKPEKIIYVSCDPATLARDLKILSGDYDIKVVEALDMFPRTAHVESVVLLKLKY